MKSFQTNAGKRSAIFANCILLRGDSGEAEGRESAQGRKRGGMAGWGEEEEEEEAGVEVGSEEGKSKRKGNCSFILSTTPPPSPPDGGGSLFPYTAARYSFGLFLSPFFGRISSPPGD